MKLRYKVWRESNMEGGDTIGDLVKGFGAEVLLDDIRVGDEFLVRETVWELNPKRPSRYELLRVDQGYSGNMNGNIKRYHGWRGTVDGCATYVHGMHKVVSIGEIHTETQEHLVPPAEDYIIGYDVVHVTGHWAYVTIDEADAHPDWE